MERICYIKKTKQNTHPSIKWATAVWSLQRIISFVIRLGGLQRKEKELSIIIS